MIKKILILASILGLIAFISLWSMFGKGVDNQNKTVIFLKEFIPIKISKKIRDTVFIIPDLKQRNKFLTNLVEKYEQGLEGNFFSEEEILSKKNKKKYLLKEFFLPFQRLDNRLGWAGTENSLRAHYLEIVDKNVIAISGKGKSIFFEKKNINSKKLNQKIIENNIQNILENNSYKLIGIRDLYVEDNKVYISMQHKDKKGYTVNIYRANLNFDKLKFELFFETNEYWDNYNVFSGGRIEKFKDNKILFSIGHSGIKKKPQDNNSLLGKIISIEKETKKHELLSIGNRNPQGLFYVENLNLVINTEHGPKGGDEINFNFRNEKKIPNFGWDVAAYGTTYKNEKIYKMDSHSKYGFDEPFKYYNPSIGISEILYLSPKKNLDKKNYLYVSSLRAGSIYVIEVDDKFEKIIDEDQLFFGKRIRDIDYDEENKVFLILFEFVPSIGVLKIKE